MAVDTLIPSSPVMIIVGTGVETEVWGSIAAPDTTHTGSSPIGTIHTNSIYRRIYCYLITYQMNKDAMITVEAFAKVPVRT
jgi:hypothetical protein